MHLVVHEDRPPTIAAVVALAPPPHRAPASASGGAAEEDQVANSYQRYNRRRAREAAIRLQHQVTKFYVYRAEDKDDPSKWMKLDGYGRTPGDRKTDAIRRSGLAR